MSSHTFSIIAFIGRDISNYDTELQINAAMLQSLDRCLPDIWSGFLAEVCTGVQ